jgi:prepilin-type N-terminal cleavage/methylation domain-containing protein/prepilin-type processing-associated H-X9-DG protein
MISEGSAVRQDTLNRTGLHTTALDAATADRDAFTLTELMVVVATVGILAAVVLPALAGTKTDSKTFQCMNNLKQLATAWQLYADESNDRLVNLSTYESDSSFPLNANDRQGIPWRCQIALVSRTFPAGMPPVSEAGQKYLIEQGFKQPTPTIAGPLYGFAPNADLVHCPADPRANLPMTFGPYGGPFAWDSYSGSALLNGESAGDSHDLLKRTEVTRPANKFIWAEGADARGENLGSWWLGNYGTPTDARGPFATATFSDSPAAFHPASANFNFCDGHVESHKWKDPTTIAFANDFTNLEKDLGGSGTGALAENHRNADAIWVAQHYAGKQNP